MDKSRAEGSPPFLDRSVAVVLIIIARYLLERDPHFGSYLEEALQHAISAHLQDGDLSILRLILTSLGLRGS